MNVQEEIESHNTKRVDEKNSLREYGEKIKEYQAENKMNAKEKLNLSEKEKVYLASLSKKERKRFINKSLGRDPDHGISGITKRTPFGKTYF